MSKMTYFLLLLLMLFDIAVSCQSERFLMLKAKFKPATTTVAKSLQPEPEKLTTQTAVRTTVAATLVAPTTQAHPKCGQTQFNNTSGKPGGASVVNGVYATREVPWHALVGAVDPRFPQLLSPYCSGALIADEWVLLQASCCVLVKDRFQETFVMLGETSRRSDSPFPYKEKPYQMFIHPLFNNSYIGAVYDFCMLKIPKASLTFTWAIQTICLPQSCTEIQQCEDNAGSLSFSRWGYLPGTYELHNLLLFNGLSRLQSSVCRENASNFQEDSQLCINSLPNQDIWNCDLSQSARGSVLNCYHDRRYYLVGISSGNAFQDVMVCTQTPIVFGRLCLPVVRQWIDDVMAGLFATTMTPVSSIGTTSSATTMSTAVTAKSKETCGRNVYNASSARNSSGIVNGRDALSDEFPWHALLSYIRNSGESGTCSGVLVSSQWVLTSAFCCINAAEITVQLGFDMISNAKHSATAKMIVVHPSYESTTKQFDFCLLQLPVVDLTWSWKIQAICLPEKCDQINQECQPGDTATVTGWGPTDPNAVTMTPDTLQSIDVTIGGDCSADQFCATVEPGKGLCFDSGSPLACYIGDRNILNGIYLGNDNCSLNGTEVFSRVCTVRSWIDSYLSGTAFTTPMTEAPIAFQGCGLTKFSNSGTSQPGVGIINGRISQYDEFPWNVYIGDRTSRSCSGALIDKSWVLTTGFCCDLIVANGMNNVGLGSIFARNSSAGVPAFSYFEMANAIFFHPLYNRDTSAYDFCLLQILDVNLQFSWSLQTICLPQLCDANYEAQIDGEVLVLGWGKTSPAMRGAQDSPTLKVAALTVMAPGSCKQEKGTEFQESSQICALARTNSTTGPCSGDGGGPMSAFINGRHILNGLTKNIVSGMGCKSPFLFSRVCLVTPWIKDVMLGRTSSTTQTAITTKPLTATPRPPSSLSCGTSYYSYFSEPNITTSQEERKTAQPLEVPWAAYLNVSENSYCEGALVDPFWVLTTASCCNSSQPIRVNLGSVKRSEYFDYSEVSTRTYVHPSYNASNADYNFCLVQIPKAPTTYQWSIQPICLPENCDACLSGSNVSIAGWIDKDALEIQSVSIGPSLKCPSCFGNNSLPSQACAGNAGRSVVCNKNDKALLLGLIPGTNCGQSFTRFNSVCKILSWVNSVISGLITTTTATAMPYRGCGLTMYNNISQVPGQGIYGDRIANAKEVPWLANIMYGSETGAIKCLGALISEFWILTSAICCTQSNSSFTIRMGFSITFSADAPYFENGLTEAFVHPNFTQNSSAYNFCLIKVPKVNTRYSWDIQPICLPQFCDDANDCPLYSYASAPGSASELSGSSDVVLMADFQLISSSTCQQGLNSIHIDSNICGKWVESAKLESNEAGNPLHCFVNGRAILTGIANGIGERCLFCNATVNLFGRVCSAKPWIDTILNY